MVAPGYGGARQCEHLLAEGPDMTTTPGTRVSWTAWSDKHKAPTRMYGVIRHVGRGSDPVVKLELEDPTLVRNADTYTQRLSNLAVEVPLPGDLDGLCAAIADLDALPPIEAARMARALADVARGLLMARSYRAIYEATRGASHKAVAQDLGVNATAVHFAVTEHRKSLRGQP